MESTRSRSRPETSLKPNFARHLQHNHMRHCVFIGSDQRIKESDRWRAGPYSAKSALPRAPDLS
jgi:hypothetical protein